MCTSSQIPPLRDRACHTALVPVCPFGRTPSCDVVLRVPDLVHGASSMCSSCLIVHVWWNAQHSGSDQIPNPPQQRIVLRGVHGICSRPWPGLNLRVPLSSPKTSRLHVKPVTCSDQHTARILNRVETNGCLMSPHHTSRRSCLCLGGHSVQRPPPQPRTLMDKNTQSDRMFISFDSHPYGVDTTPTVYGWLHPSVPHAPVVDMDVSSSRLPTSRHVAAWVTHSGSRCSGVSPAPGITYEVSCTRPEWHGCKTLSQIVVCSLRHVVVSRMVPDVWYPRHSQVLDASFSSVVRPSLVHAAHTRGRCLRRGSPPHVTITVSG